MRCEQSPQKVPLNARPFRGLSYNLSLPYKTRFWALKIRPIFSTKQNFSKHFTKTLAAILVCISIGSSSGICATGTASFYGRGEKLNRHTANGDVFYPNHLTAASYKFKTGSYVACTSTETKKSVVVYVNDLGPSKKLNRLIDLSYGAFRLIDDPAKGLITVSCQEVKS